MGVVECVTYKLVVPFQVLCEKEGKLHNIWPFFLPLWFDEIFIYTDIWIIIFSIYPLQFDEIFLTAEIRTTRKITIRKKIR